MLETAPIPGGSSGLGLYQRGSDYLIKIVGGQGLMSARAHGSEEALGEISCAEFAQREGARILIGGLGVGFTLSSALRQLGPDTEVIVAELVPAVVAWNRGRLGEFAGHPLRDDRVRVREGDVSLILGEAALVLDAIVLDVDNGPEGLTRKANLELTWFGGHLISQGERGPNTKNETGVWAGVSTTDGGAGPIGA